MTEDVTAKNDIVAFGEEEQAEQMLQILNSDEIRWHIINKYNLMEHYEIDTSDQYKLTKLYQEFDDNVSFKRTEFLSIRVDVLDKSADTAAMIANDIAEMVDVAKNRMQKERAKEALKIIAKEYDEFKEHMQQVDDSLRFLASKGILDVEKQTEMLSTEYYQAIASGNAKAEKKLQRKLDTLAKYASAFTSLTDNGEYERERLLLLRSKFEEIKVDANSDVPHKFTVNRAYPAEKKAYPIRWLIVVISTISAFLLAVLVVIGVENFKRIQEARKA